MKKVIFLIIFFFIVKLNTILKTDEGEDPIKIINTCNKQIMREYLKDLSEIPKELQYSSPQIKEICPNLDKTCCSHENLHYLKTQLLSGREKLNSLLIYHDTLIKNLKNIDQEKLENYLNSEDIKKKENCLGEDFNSKLKYLNNIKEKNEITREKLKSSLKNTIKYYSSFACEFCHTRMQHAIKIEKKKAKIIRQNFQDLKTRFEALIYLSDYISFFYEYSWISKIGICLNNHQAEDFQELKEIHKNLDKYKIELLSCQNEEFFKDQYMECMASLFLSNPFDRIWTYELIFKYKSDVENGIRNLGNFVNDWDFEYLEFRGDFDGNLVFYEKTENGSLDFEHGMIVVSDIESLEMYRNAMNMDIWEFCKVFIGFLNVIILFF